MEKENESEEVLESETINTSLGPDGYPRRFCGVSDIGSLRLPEAVRGSDKDELPLYNTVNVCLDRQSFLERGWLNQDLGAYNNGSLKERRGIFLSMFYALQNWHPDDLGHPWNEKVHDFDRGLGAHIHHWKKGRCERSFKIIVWDHLIPPSDVIRIPVIGRKRGQPPFTPDNPCGADNIAGCYDPHHPRAIYIRADIDFALGARITADTYIGGKKNLTYVVAHETGHAFGFGHVLGHPECMMGDSLPDPPLKPKWQRPEEVMNPTFARIGKTFCAEP